MFNNNSNMSDHFATPLTYIASGSAVVLTFINTNAAAIGVFIAIMTFIANAWFKWQQLQIEKAKLKEEERRRLDGDIEQ